MVKLSTNSLFNFHLIKGYSFFFFLKKIWSEEILSTQFIKLAHVF
jgi:hypothetical protein